MKKIKKSLIIILVVLLSFLGISCREITYTEINSNDRMSVKPELSSTDDIKVHYIDVGQGDSELIQVEGKNILIDAGDNDDAYFYLKLLGITNIDYVIATHPHEDHIGGMTTIINKINIGNFYAPKVTTNTKTFENMVDALKKKNLQMKVPSVGEEITIGNAKLTFLAPNSEKYKDLNNYSIVTRLTYGEDSFLFVGDAEELSEKEIIKKGLDVKANVLKIGHHGSESSTGESFLNAVNPEYAVISVGKDNKYGHPKESTLKKLKSKKILRTDLNGTIILSSNGNRITVMQERKTEDSDKK